MSEWVDIFCSNVRYLRASNGLTQKEMAKIMGISVGSLRKIERGILPGISWQVILRLNEYFMLPIEMLLDDYL